MQKTIAAVAVFATVSVGLTALLYPVPYPIGAVAWLLLITAGLLVSRLVLFPGDMMRLLKPMAVGATLGGMAVLLVYPFSPAMAAAASLVLFLFGLYLGILLTFPGASFIMGLGVFSVLMMGAGYAAGERAGWTPAWVTALFLLSMLLGLFLPPLPNFQRALLAALLTVSVGAAGALLGAAFGAALVGALAFLSLGAFSSMVLPEDRAMALALHSVLASFMMGLGFALAFFVGQAGAVVLVFFGLSLVVSLFLHPSRARLLLLLLAPAVIFLALGYLTGLPFGLAHYTVIFFLVLALLLDLAFYFASDTRLLAVNDAWVMAEADCTRGYRIARELAGAAGVPMPRLAIVASDAPNLFTVGRSPSRAVIAVTQGLLDRLSDEELEALLAHEIFHIRERDLLPMTLAATLASLVGGAAQYMMFDQDREFNPLVLAGVGLAAPFFALLLHLSTPRAREKRADAGASLMTRNGAALADALEKLERGADETRLVANPATEPLFAVNPFRGGWLVSLFATHPSTEERVELLRRGSRAPGGG